MNIECHSNRCRKNELNHIENFFVTTFTIFFKIKTTKQVYFSFAVTLTNVK